jgi:hypothetical protein
MITGPRLRDLRLQDFEPKELVVKSLRLIGLPLAAFATMAMLAGCGNTASPTALGSGLDTTPPPAPASLTLSQDGMGHPLLTWDASAAPDVVGYRVYLYSPSPERDNSYVIADDPDAADSQFLLPIEGGAIQAIYRVRAVDAAGNTSAFSAPATISIHSGGGGGGRSPNQIE